MKNTPSNKKKPKITQKGYARKKMSNRFYDPRKSSQQQQQAQSSLTNYCVSNMFELIDGGRVFEYNLKYEADLQNQLQENKELFYTSMEKQFPKGFLTKVVNFRDNKFYSVSMKPKFMLRLDFAGIQV